VPNFIEMNKKLFDLSCTQYRLIL